MCGEAILFVYLLPAPLQFACVFRGARLCVCVCALSNAASVVVFFALPDHAGTVRAVRQAKFIALAFCI